MVAAQKQLTLEQHLRMKRAAAAYVLYAYVRLREIDADAPGECERVFAELLAMSDEDIAAERARVEPLLARRDAERGTMSLGGVFGGGR